MKNNSTPVKKKSIFNADIVCCVHMRFESKPFHALLNLQTVTRSYRRFSKKLHYYLRGCFFVVGKVNDIPAQHQHADVSV